MLFKGLLDSRIYNIISKDVFATKSGAFLFSSKDKMLNEMLAKLIAYSIMCGNQKPCYKCDNCKRNEIGKHPDLIVVDKEIIQVADISKIIDSCQMKPMIAEKKVILILNAENMNEIAQNKLLKTLEEPTESANFILTTCNMNKLLTTIVSRCKKYDVVLDDSQCIKHDLEMQNIATYNADLNLAQIIGKNNSSDSSVLLDKIANMFIDLEKTSDIPKVVAKFEAKPEEKQKFFELCEDLFYNLLRYLNKNEYNESYISYFDMLQLKFNQKVLIRMLNIIEKANKAFVANVNFNYVLDTMLYAILKEKHLCK